MEDLSKEFEKTGFRIEDDEKNIEVSTKLTLDKSRNDGLPLVESTNVEDIDEFGGVYAGGVYAGDVYADDYEKISDNLDPNSTNKNLLKIITDNKISAAIITLWILYLIAFAFNPLTGWLNFALIGGFSLGSILLVGLIALTLFIELGLRIYDLWHWKTQAHPGKMFLKVIGLILLMLSIPALMTFIGFTIAGFVVFGATVATTSTLLASIGALFTAIPVAATATWQVILATPAMKAVIAFLGTTLFPGISVIGLIGIIAAAAVIVAVVVINLIKYFKYRPPTVNNLDLLMEHLKKQGLKKKLSFNKTELELDTFKKLQIQKDQRQFEEMQKKMENLEKNELSSKVKVILQNLLKDTNKNQKEREILINFIQWNNLDGGFLDKSFKSWLINNKNNAKLLAEFLIKQLKSDDLRDVIIDKRILLDIVMKVLPSILLEQNQQEIIESRDYTINYWNNDGYTDYQDLSDLSSDDDENLLLSGNKKENVNNNN